MKSSFIQIIKYLMNVCYKLWDVLLNFNLFKYLSTFGFNYGAKVLLLPEKFTDLNLFIWDFP